MGGVVSAIGSAVSAAVSGVEATVTAPVQAVSSIASGGNVGEAVLQGVTQTVAGTHESVAGPGDTLIKPLADKTGISSLPIARNYYDEGQASHEIVQSSERGQLATRGQSLSLYRNAAEVGGSVVGGFAAAPYVAGASSAELGGYAALGGAGLQLANGKPAGALSALGDYAGLSDYGIDLGGLASGGGTPKGGSPSSIRVPAGALASGSKAPLLPVTQSQMAGIGLMAALVGAVYLFQKR